MVKFEIKKSNYQNLPRLAESLRKSKVSGVELSITEQKSEIPKFSEIMPFVYQVLDYELFFGVWLKNIPFCAVNPEAVDHILTWPGRFSGKKIKECRTCFWNKRCLGFSQEYLSKYGAGEICPRPDLPWEVMIEVTPRCNFNCRFCFNQISFADRGIKEFSQTYLKKIISRIAKAGIKIIRFTGGEPLLRKDIFELVEYSKNQGLETRLNTNASLVSPVAAKKFKGILDNVLIPIESYHQKKEAEITGYQNSLEKKIRAINLFKKEQIPVVRVGTVANRENIVNFDKIARLISKLPLDEWEFYRPIPVEKKQELNSGLVNSLADKIIKWRKKLNKPVFIANALPFCAIKDLNKLNNLSKGALFDEGHTRIAIDPRDFVKPHYFLNERIGQPLDILGAWHSSFEKKMRNLEYLPLECKDCHFAYKCRGGSRQIAKMVFGSYRALDPLANLDNLK